MGQKFLNIFRNSADESTPKGQRALATIALLAAQQDGRVTSDCIKNYNLDINTIEGQQALIKIAKAAAQQNGASTSVHIQNYALDKNSPEGQKALFEIAKLAIMQNAKDTYQSLSNYGLEKDSAEGKLRWVELSNHLFIHFLMQINNWSGYQFRSNTDKFMSENIPMDGNSTYDYSLGQALP